MNVIFFGSTSDSVLVLNVLSALNPSPYTLKIVAVVTQPPRPVGRKQVMTPTPVEVWAKAHHIPVLSFLSSPPQPSFFQNDQTVIDTLQPFTADLLISASFGQHIPVELIKEAKFGGLNVHPSLLPRWRGADPVPWAIMAGDAQTGVTVVTLSEDFDSGTSIAQKKIPITDTDFSDPLRTKLFKLGADLLIQVLPEYLSRPTKFTHVRKGSESTYARRFTRDDGFEPWETIQKAFEDPAEARRIDRKFRALMPWPGLWTEIRVTRNKKQEKGRLKILACHVSPVSCLILDSVQLEGKTPVPFSQFQKAYRFSVTP